MTDKQLECVRRVKALVFVVGADEEPFLEETVPLWLKLYPSAEIFLYFPTTHFITADPVMLAGGTEEAGRVHVFTSACKRAFTGFPVGEKSVTSIMDSVTEAVAYTGALSSDFVMRVAPFTIPMRVEYVAQGIEQGAIYMTSSGGLYPFDTASYVLSVELWHRLMRIVSLMNVIGLEDGYADLYIQSLAFAVAHTERFMYVQRNNLVGNVMRHIFDYSKAGTAEYMGEVLPIAGFIDMRPDPDSDMKKVMQWTRKLSTLVLTYNAAS